LENNSSGIVVRMYKWAMDGLQSIPYKQVRIEWFHPMLPKSLAKTVAIGGLD